MNKNVKTIKLTTDMLLDLMRGKDIYLNCIDQIESGVIESTICFKGPFDGVYLTHEEVSNLEREAEARIMKTLPKPYTFSKYNVNPEKLNY